MAGFAGRFQTTYNTDFGSLQGFSLRKKKLSSSTSNLYDTRTPESRAKKNVSFKTPRQYDNRQKYDKKIGSRLGVDPMKRSSSYQNINHKRNDSANKAKLFGSSDNFDSGFSSDENTIEGKSHVYFQAKLLLFLFLNTNQLSALLYLSKETIA